MQSKIVLISDDFNFFEYIIPRIKLRKTDELFKYGFDNIPEIIHLLSGSILIINSENSENKTLELLSFVKNSPSVVFAYNNNPEFECCVYQAGAFAYITPLTSQEEMQAKLIHVFNAASAIEKSKLYRELLVKSNIIMPNNEVFINYEMMLDKELEKIKSTSSAAVLAAISPNDKSKFLLKSNQIETIILNNIRKNDLLMNYAPNKYFLILYNTDVANAKKLWAKICANIPEKIYAGFADIMSKSRQQLINEVLNKLHEAINFDKEAVTGEGENISDTSNFKIFKQEFNKKVSQIISPVFYLIQQKYNERFAGMSIRQAVGECYGELVIQSKAAKAEFKITCPGCAKINIDINYFTAHKIPPKRITLDPQEFEAGLLEDLLEQFAEEFNKEINNDNTQC